MAFTGVTNAHGPSQLGLIFSKDRFDKNKSLKYFSLNLLTSKETLEC